MFFLLLFVFVPLVELYFMLQIGSQIGALSTVLLVVLTAITGGLLVRYQGFTTLMRVRSVMAAGEAPALEMLEGAVLLLCGLMLLLPGFITDALGFLLLIPALRRYFIIWMLKRSRVIRPAGGSHPGSGESHRIIEIDSWEKDN